MVGESTHAGGAHEIIGLDSGWSTQLLRIAQALEAILADHGALSGLLDGDHDHGLSLTAASLLDDDHSQYALLAGRGTGQTLNGGLGAGNDLTLLGTAHATAGSVIIQSSSIFEMDGATGQLKLPTTGSSAGLLVGGDVHLYRTAADVWSSPDSLRIGGYQRVGSETAPTNTTAGDLTSARLKVGDGAFGTGVEFSVLGDGALSGFLRVGSETAPTNTTAGDLTVARLNVGNVAFGTGVEAQIEGDAAVNGRMIIGAAALDADSALRVTGTISASGGAAVGLRVMATLTAVANADLLYGQVFAPTFAKGAFTTLSAIGQRINMTISSGSGTIDTAINLELIKPTIATTNYYINFDTATADVNVAIGSNVSIPVIIGGVARKIYAT